MFTVYYHTEFYIPNSGGSLVITVKLEAKRKFHADVISY
jgi:hypothetical protein